MKGNTMTTLAIETNLSVDRYLETPHHFYASSFCTWKTGEDMRDVINHMEKEGHEYTLWYVPMSNDSNYQIKYYAPQVAGSFVLSTFTPKKKPRK
jgi:hypothetical protein